MLRNLDEVRRNFVRVQLRISAGANDLNVKWLKDFLRLTEDDSRSKRVYADEHDGIAGCEFADGPPLAAREEISRWQRPAFRTTTEWLKSRSPEEFDQLRERGYRADLLVVEGEALIPLELLQEIVRLKLMLLFMAPPSEHRSLNPDKFHAEL